MSDLANNGPLARRHRSGSKKGTLLDWLKDVPKTAALMPLLAVPMLYTGPRADAPPAEADLRAEVRRDVPALAIHTTPRVEYWIDRFRTYEPDAFLRLMERRAPYAGLIRAKLAERGMPEGLLHLAVIESGLSPRAVSRASAVGVWQFMSPTAVQYGLRVDEWVDERRDPERATDAALDYLEYLHQRYGSWYLAAAAYNSGPGRVDRVLRRHAGGRTGDEELYWEILEHLPRETREYVPRLIAATVLARESGAYEELVNERGAYAYDVVYLPANTPLSAVARALDVEPAVLRDLNPHLLRGVTPPGEAYGVRVPSAMSGQVVAALGRGAAVRRTD